MDNLDTVSLDDLRRALDAVDRKTPAQRLIAAIAFKHGITQTALADWFDIERKTVYNWLSRLDDEALVASAHDEPRPGRPRKLSSEAIERLSTRLTHPPTADDDQSWTPQLVQQYVRETFGVRYSLPSCRRLLRELPSEIDE